MDNKEDNSSPPSDRPRPKVDMKHGFVRSIILNQIERDEYHKLTVAMQEVEISPQMEKNEKRKEEKEKRLSAVESEVKRETSGKRAPQQLYTPPHARNEGKAPKKETPKTESPTADQTRSSDRPTTTSTIVSELAGENSAQRQRARDKLLRERKSNGSTGANDILQSQDTPTTPPIILKADQPLFRLKITTDDEQGELEDCIVYEGDTPARVAKRLVQKLQLSEANSRKIRTKVEEAMMLYLAEKNK